MLNKLPPKHRRNVLRILPFGVIWLLLAQIFLISDYAAVDDLSNIPEGAIRLDVGIYLFASLAVLVLGLLVGTVELLYLNRRFADRTLTQKVVFKTLFYAAFMLAAMVVLYPIAAAMELDSGLLDGRVWRRLSGFLTSKPFLGTSVQLLASLGASLFYSEISEHMGQGVLLNFITGKYHTPKEETRIFLFSDMKDSTQIAERVGHLAYFELLKAYYRDLSDAIVASGGEIYQYVGDEVIVSWPVEAGLREGSCVNCFLGMKRDLARRAEWYRTRFGPVPDFKAALHVGAVTTGEIGALKKEIVFTGDVLNATSRIQSLCKEFEVDLLLSGDLVHRLVCVTDRAFSPVGQRTLRGREEPVELFTLASSDTGSPPP